MLSARLLPVSLLLLLSPSPVESLQLQLPINRSHFEPLQTLYSNVLQSIFTPFQVPVQTTWKIPDGLDLLSVTVQELASWLGNGSVTSVDLTHAFLARIEANNHRGLKLRAVIETAPLESVLAIAQALDEERLSTGSRGPFHGIPILIKDNVATDPELGMNTTAGSFALLGSVVPRDAFIVQKLRAAGAIIIGKSSLSEWANYRGGNTNGWSARGGQTQSAYVVGGFSAGGDPCGSSSGSGVGVSADFAPIAIGTETDGSIVCPANRAALYGLKPTVGLTSRAGIIPISHTQDSPGPMARSAWDVAAMMDVIVGRDPRDVATTESLDHATSDSYTSAIIPNGFSGLKIGIPRSHFYNSSLTNLEPEVYSTVETVLSKMATLGAILHDPADLPTIEELWASKHEKVVLDFEFKVDLALYLEELEESEVRNLMDVIKFNDRNAAVEMPEGQCCQEILLESLESTGFKDPRYIKAISDSKRLGTDGLQAVFDKYHLDVLAIPAEARATYIAAISGWPIATVPIGYYGEGSGKVGQPYGLAFIARRFEERKAIRAMGAFEEQFPKRRVPSQLLRGQV